MIKVDFHKKDTTVFIFNDMKVVECNVDKIHVDVNTTDEKELLKGVTYELSEKLGSKNKCISKRFPSKVVFGSKEDLKAEVLKQFD